MEGCIVDRCDCREESWRNVLFINTQQLNRLSGCLFPPSQMENSILQRFQQVLREIHEEEKVDEPSSSSESETCEQPDKPAKRKMIEKPSKSVPNEPIVLDSGEELDQEELSKDVDKMMMDLEGELPKQLEEPLSSQETPLQKTTPIAPVKPVWKKNLKALAQSHQLSDSLGKNQPQLKTKSKQTLSSKAASEDEKFIKSLQQLLDKEKTGKKTPRQKKGKNHGRDKQLWGGKSSEVDNKLKENIIGQINQHNECVRKIDKAPTKDIFTADRQKYEADRQTYQSDMQTTPERTFKLEKTFNQSEKQQSQTDKVEKPIYHSSKAYEEKKTQVPKKLEYPNFSQTPAYTPYPAPPTNFYQINQTYNQIQAEEDFDAKTAKKSGKMGQSLLKAGEPPVAASSFIADQSNLSPSFVQSFLTRRQNSNKVDLGVCSLAELIDQAHSCGVISNELYFEFVNSNNDESQHQFIHCFVNDELGNWNFFTHKISIADHRRLAELLLRLSPEKYILFHPQALNNNINEFLLRIYELPPEDYQIMMGCMDSLSKYSWWKPIRVKYEHLLRDSPASKQSAAIKIEAGKVIEKKTVAKDVPPKKPKQNNFPRPANIKKTLKNLSPEKSDSRSNSSSELSPEQQIGPVQARRKLFLPSNYPKQSKRAVPMGVRKSDNPPQGSERGFRK